MAEQLENEITIEAELSVESAAKPKRAAVRCGTGIYGAAAASSKFVVTEDLGGPSGNMPSPATSIG
jgi:hypothetical protein